MKERYFWMSLPKEEDIAKNQAFLRQYQVSLLLALVQRELLTRQQFDRCIALLEKNEKHLVDFRAQV